MIDDLVVISKQVILHLYLKQQQINISVLHTETMACALWQGVLYKYKLYSTHYVSCVPKYVPISRLNVTDNQSRVTIHRISRENLCTSIWRYLIGSLPLRATAQSNFSIEVNIFHCELLNFLEHTLSLSSTVLLLCGLFCMSYDTS